MVQIAPKQMIGANCHLGVLQKAAPEGVGSLRRCQMEE